MSKFEGLRLKPKQQEPVIDENIINIENDTSQPDKSSLDRLSQFGSGVVSGVSRLGLSEGRDQLGAGVMEVAPGVVAPILPASAIAGAEAAEKGLEALESMKPEEDDGIGNVLYKAGEFGGAAASVPIPGAGAAGVTASAASKVASTMPREIPKAMLYLASKYGVNPTVNTVKRVYNTPFGEGATIGAGSGLLQEGGVDPLVADLTSMAFTPTIMRTPDRIYQTVRHPLKNVAYPTARKVFDINKNNFNLRAAEAANRLGVDLNLAELNPSNNVAWANNIAAKNLLSSKAVQLQNKNIDDRIKEIISENLNLVGPQETPETLQKIARKYDRADKLYPINPEERMVVPNESFNMALEIKNNPTGPFKSIKPSSDEKAVIDFIDKYMDTISPGASIDGVKIPGYKPPLQPIDSAILLSTKKSLNSNNPSEPIRWNNADPNIRNLLKPFNKSIGKDATQLKDNHPKWYKAFSDAEKFYGDVATRKKLEDKLISGGFNYDMFNYQPGMMSRNLNTPKKIKNIKHTYKHKPKETKEKLNQNFEDLGIVSDAIVKRNKSNPNPSGTALVGANIASVAPFLGVAGSALTLNPIGLTGLLSPVAKFLGPRFAYNNVINNKKLIVDTIDNMKNSKPKIPFKNRLINSRANYIYPTINNIRNRED